MELRQVAIVAAITVAAFGACTRVESGNAPSVSLGDGGTAGDTAGQTGSLAGDGGDGMGGMLTSSGGASTGVELSMWPTFASDPDQSRDAQAVFAAVSVLSAGAATLTLAERWDELSGATGSPRTLAWNRLDAMIKPYRDRGGSVAFCIDVVDREQAAWPFTATVDSDAARQALHRTIDELYARYAAQLSHLCFGYEIDRYLGAAKAEDAAGLVRLLKDGVAYARQHPARTEALHIGVAATLSALSDPENAAASWLLGDEAVAVYDPVGDAELKPPASGAEEVGVALDALAAGSSLPLALWEIGYPSAAGSSQKAQRQFYDALFELIAERGERLSFVSLFGLSDRATTDCDAEAALFGDDMELTALRSAARCSMGLRAEGGDAKLAWPTVLAALARYR